MSLKYGILFFLIFVTVLFLVIKNYETWNWPIDLEIEKVIAKREDKRTHIPPPAKIQKEYKTVESHSILSEKNIFNPERKEFLIPNSAVESSKRLLTRPSFILYGVTLAGNYQAVSLGSPGGLYKKGEREVITLKVGDQIGEYKLAKVLPDRIVMEASDYTFEVLLYDPKMPKKRSYVKTENKPTYTITPSAPTTLPSESPKIVPPKEIVLTQRESAPMAKEPVQERVVPLPSLRTGTSPIASPPAPGTPSIELPPTPGEPPIMSPHAPGAPPVSASIEGIPPSPITVPQTPVNRGPGEN